VTRTMFVSQHDSLQCRGECWEGGRRTGSELRLVRNVVLVEVLRLLLGLLVVDGVCTGYNRAKSQPISFSFSSMLPRYVHRMRLTSLS